VDIGVSEYDRHVVGGVDEECFEVCESGGAGEEETGLKERWPCMAGHILIVTLLDDQDVL